MLSQEPNINENLSQRPLETWRKLGMIDLNHLYKMSPFEPEEGQQYATIQYRDATYQGQTVNGWI
jgi:hypothetical protein